MGNSVISQLRQLRHTRGMTINDASAAAGVSSPYLSELERGKRKVSLEVIERILSAYGKQLAIVPKSPSTAPEGVFAGLKRVLEAEAEENCRCCDPDSYCAKCGRYSEIIERGKCPACFEAWGYT